MRILLLNASARNSGATQEILRMLCSAVSPEDSAELVCLGDLNIRYCTGCKSCYQTGFCHQHDDMEMLMDRMNQADILVFAAPSYWADVPGQCKVFIDRCTPYGDTNPHPEHPVLRAGKRCYGIALRTGSRPMECEHIIETIRHWCGHMNIALADSMYFCGINDKRDILPHQDKIMEKAREWFVK